jgi:hypothetical protein
MNDQVRMYENAVDKSGWRLSEREWRAVVKEGLDCAFCSHLAGWRWVKSNDMGTPVQWVSVCNDHRNVLSPSEDDLNQLVQSDSELPQRRFITRNDLQKYLAHCHWIPALKGVKSNVHLKFAEFSHLEMMREFHVHKAVKPSFHFSGWEVTKSFVIAFLNTDKSWTIILGKHNARISSSRKSSG